MKRKKIRRGQGARVVGKSWRLADEVRYIQSRAALYDATFVSVGPLALFSTDTGDAWLLDPSERFAVRLARDGDPESVHIVDTDTTFSVGWTGHYSVDGRAFTYIDMTSGRIVTIVGYPTDQIAQLG